MAEIADLESQWRAQLAADPTHHVVALSLAELLLGDGRTESAVALLLQHADDRACGDLLREYFIGERMSDELLRLLEWRGSDASASGLVDHAVAAHLRGDIDGAMQRCKLAIAADPTYAPAHNHLGRALFNARRSQPARAAFVQAVRIAPHYAEAWHNLGHALRDNHEIEQAERAYGHALRLRPAFRSALLNLGIVQAGLGKHEAALENFHTLQTLDPGNTEAWFNAGVCEHLLERLDEASASYDRALTLDPRNPRLRLLYGRLRNELFDSDAALAHFRRALELDPKSAEAWVEIAIVHAQANRIDDAERAVLAGLAIAPGDSGLLLEKANVARQRGHAALAVHELARIDPVTLPPHLRSRHRKVWESASARLERDNALQDSQQQS
jgi:tetratricopeptide (TPR) repeat protein